MKSIKANQNTLELMAKHEEAIGQLYAKYALLLKDSNFWNQISNDEYEHASWIRKLAQKIDDKTVFFDEERFDDQAITSDIEFLSTKTKTVSKIDLKQALEDAIRIESDLIEKGYFKVIETD